MIRYALLRNVADCEVWQEEDGTSVVTDRVNLGVSDPVCTVTAEIAEAEQEGLVRGELLTHGPGRVWTLTTAGERELARLTAEHGRRSRPWPTTATRIRSVLSGARSALSGLRNICAPVPECGGQIHECACDED